MVASKVNDTELNDSSGWNKISGHTKTARFLAGTRLGVLETGCGMVRRMELFLGSDSVAVSGQPDMEVTVRFGVLGGRREIIGGRRQISISVGVGTQVNALTDGSLQVMYHPGRKGFVFKEPVSQRAESKVTCKPHQAVKV